MFSHALNCIMRAYVSVMETRPQAWPPLRGKAKQDGTMELYRLLVQEPEEC